MSAPYVGHCLCGAVRFQVNSEPLTFYACHCTDCQRRTGTAFALSLIVLRKDIQVLAGSPGHYEATLPDGRTKAGRICHACGTRLWGEPRRNEHIGVVQSGVLEPPLGLTPVAHIFTRSAQPWVEFPEDAILFPGQPDDPMALAILWRNRQRAQR